MTLKIVKIIATIALFRLISFSNFFIIMSAISCAQITNMAFARKHIGYELVTQIFYVCVAISIIIGYGLEVLPAVGLILSVLSLFFFIACELNYTAFSNKIVFKPQRFCKSMVLLSIGCVYISMSTRHHPTQIWISPVVLLLGFLVRELIDFLRGFLNTDIKTA